jgi:putative transposase
VNPRVDFAGVIDQHGRLPILKCRLTMDGVECQRTMRLLPGPFDTQRLLFKVVVHLAGIHDRVGAKMVLRALPTAFPRLERIWADQGYAGALRTWTREHTGGELEVVSPWWRQIKRYFPEMLEPLGVAHGFHVLPRRWVVERTFAWLGRYRRLSRDYERLPTSSEALIYVTRVRLLLHCLA